MLSELFHYFKKYGQEIARRRKYEYTTIEFYSDLSGSLKGYEGGAYSFPISIFDFLSINDAIKKFRKEIDSWQD